MICLEQILHPYISYNDLSINQFSNNSLEYGYKGHLGNLGSATKRVVFECNLPFGSNTGFSSFDDYILHPNKSKYFILKKPYTELYYVAGSKREQIFNINHAQSINSNLKLGFDFNKNNSTGFYSHQKSDNSNFSAQLEYISNNNRYHVIGNTVFNKISSQENGGLVLDSLFEEVKNITKSTIPTFLDSAENNWKGRSYTIKQTYLLGKKEFININDTIDSVFFNPKSNLFHSIQYSIWNHAYNDYFPDINYYPAIYRDTLITADTLSTRSIKQTIGWSNTIYGVRNNDSINPLNFEINLSQEYVEYHQNELDSFVNNIWINTQIGRYNKVDIFDISEKIDYEIDNGKIDNITSNPSTNSLIFSLTNTTNVGQLSLKISDDIIMPFENNEFLVMIDGIGSDYSFDNGTLNIPFNFNDKKITVIGTHVIPEFYEITPLVLATSFIALIILRKYKKLFV